MKHLTCTLLSLVCCAAPTALCADSAEFADAPPEASWTFTPAVTSQYLFRGVRVAGACFQPGLDYAYGPLALGLWGSVGLEEQTAGDSDPEIDVYGSYTIPLGRSGAELVPGVQLYTYPEAERTNGLYSATFEPSLAVNVLVAGVRVTPKAYYDFMLKGATFECTAAVALPLPRLGTELVLSATVGTYKWTDVTANATPAEKNWGDYWTIGASVPYQVTANSALALGVLYSKGRNNFYKQGTDPRVRNDAAMGRTAVTLSYSISR